MKTTFLLLKHRHALLVWIITCLSSVSCSHYQHFPLSYHGIKTLDSTVVTMYLVDNEHVLTNVWAIKKYTFKNDDISCTIEKVPETFAVEIVQTISKEDVEVNKNQVLLFAKPELTKKLAQTGSITFDYHELDRIQVVEKDDQKNISKAVTIVVGILGGVALLLLILLIIAIFLTGV